jgi:alginate O-acetyltransferase complex protein AlgI
LIFNSIEFGILFFVAVLLCALLPGYRLQILLVASFVFYSWISWFFGIILFVMSVCGYFYPPILARAKSKAARSLVTAAVVFTILLPLLILKYWNFTATAIQQSASWIGIVFSVALITYPIPPGISFHSFQLIAYVVDVFRRQAPEEKRPIVFMLFSSFFPQLVAGPIERPNHLIPQLVNAGIFLRETTKPAVQLFIYGMFLKVAVADVVGLRVDEIYTAPPQQGALLLVGTILFYVQIYCDFSGYTLMALGVARFLGVRLVHNFNAPVLAISPGDFWRRWHLSLSQWFRDYVYIPLGGDRNGHLRWIIAVAVTFLVSGLWHGANWTFLAWGAVHGAGLIVSTVIASWWPQRALARWLIVAAWMATQLFVVLTWVLFRAETIDKARQILSTIGRDFLVTGTGWSDMLDISGLVGAPGFVVGAGFLAAIWVTRTDSWLFRNPEGLPLSYRGPIVSAIQHATMLGCIGFASLNAPQTAKPFIYFQF